MINNDSVVTAYDEHLTLVEWLQKVEVLLKNGGLKETTLNDKGNATFSLTLVFNDGSKIESNAMTLKSVNEALIDLSHQCDYASQRIDDLEDQVDNKTIPLFGKYSILVPEDGAEANILPCTPSDNGKVLSVVNGEAQWASAGGGTEIKSTNIYFGYKQAMKDWEVGDADYLDSELVQITPVNTKTVCYLPYNVSQVMKPYGSNTATLLITYQSTSESSGYVKGRINIVCLKAGKSSLDLSLTQKRLYTE